MLAKYRPLLSFVIGGALLTGCGMSSGAAAPATLPTAHVAPHPTSSGIVLPATPAPRALPAAKADTTVLPTVAPPPHSPSETASSTTQPRPLDMADMATREALLVVAINQVRAANGLAPYLHNPELSAAARAHSCDLATHGMISHVSSDGRTLAQRLAGSQPPWEWPSESIAVGTDDPATAVAMWMDEPPEGWHRRNILDPDQREVGAGYCYAADDPSGNRSYWTADFSRRGGQ
jgi:uncharacterized protein YkwD